MVFPLHFDIHWSACVVTGLKQIRNLVFSGSLLTHEEAEKAKHICIISHFDSQGLMHQKIAKALIRFLPSVHHGPGREREKAVTVLLLRCVFMTSRFHSKRIVILVDGIH